MSLLVSAMLRSEALIGLLLLSFTAYLTLWVDLLLVDSFRSRPGIATETRDRWEGSEDIPQTARKTQ
jgi:hypothetical protein